MEPGFNPLIGILPVPFFFQVFFLIFRVRKNYKICECLLVGLKTGSIFFVKKKWNQNGTMLIPITRVEIEFHFRRFFLRVLIKQITKYLFPFADYLFFNIIFWNVE